MNNPALYNKKWIFIIFFAAIVLRIAYLIEVAHTPVLDFLYIDSDYYHRWAERISQGDILGGTRVFFMAPLYAYFLAAIYALGGINFFNALFVQILIGALSCALVFAAAKKYFDERTALISGIIAAIYPLFIFYDVQLLKENLMVFTALLFALTYPVDKPRRYTRLALCGILIGIHSLMRANIFLIIPFLAYYEFTRFKRLFIKSALMLSCGILAVILPVAVRNKIVGGQWVLTVAEGGMNFWTGNNPGANGAYAGAPFIRSEEPEFEDEDFRSEASRRSGRELTLKEASDYWYKESFLFISNEPQKFLRLLQRKFIGFWHATELPSDLNFYFARDFSRILRYDVITFGVIAPLAIAGIILALKQSKPNYLFLSLIASNLLSSMIFFNSSRYRLPVVPFFIIYAGFYISTLCHAFRASKSTLKPTRSFLPVHLVLLSVPFFIFTNYRDDALERISFKRVNYLNAATYYMKSGVFDKAQKMLERCLEIDPHYALAYEKYSELLLATGRRDQSKEYFAKAARYGAAAGDKRFDKTLSEQERAYVLFNLKKYNEALALFQKIIKQPGGNSKELSNNIGLCYIKLGNNTDARKELLNAIAFDEKYDKPYFNLGILSEKEGDMTKAAAYFKKALSLNPGNIKAKQKLSRYENKL